MRHLRSVVPSVICVLGVLTGLVVGAGPASAEFPPDTPVGDLPVGVAWGYNHYGVLGDGSYQDRIVPGKIDGGTQVDGLEMTSVSSYGNTACGIATGRVYCWGSSFGVNGDTSPVPAPQVAAVPLSEPTDGFGGPATAVAVGNSHVCAIAGGRTFCWGYDQHRQLGGPDPEWDLDSYTSKPWLVPWLSGMKATAITAGEYHTCVVADARAFCWGLNTSGQLGVGNWDDYGFNVRAVDSSQTWGDQPVTSIVAGEHHTCASAGGKAYCWGSNKYSQLGNAPLVNGKPIFADLPDSNVPVAVTTQGTAMEGLTVKAISAGQGISCAIAGNGADRNVYCWGGNYGQLGPGLPGTKYGYPIHVAMPDSLVGKKVAAITSRSATSCAIVEGKGYCWGFNLSGQLGNNTTANTSTPKLIDASGVLKARQLATITTAMTHTVGIAVTTPHFSDVAKNSPFYDDIAWIAGRGVARGYDTGKFQPATLISRDAMAAFLYRFHNPGIKMPVCDPNQQRKFLDVPASSPFCGAVEWLVKAGIAGAGGKFNPAAPTTRGVTASWIYRGHHRGVSDQLCAANEFADVDNGTAGCGNIEWLAAVGVTSGYEGNLFKPNDPVTREAMSAFFHRTQELTSH